MKLDKSIFRLSLLASAILACSISSQTAFAITYLPPIVVNDAYVAQNGNIISNNYLGTTTQPAITVTTTQPVTIQNSTVSGPSDLIYINGGNVTVTNTTGIATNPNILGTQKGMFVHAESPINLLVQNCNIHQTSYGVFVHNYSGNFTSSQTIKILNNIFSNIDGRPSDGNGGYATSGSYSTASVELSGVQNLPNIEIGYNKMINFPYQGQVAQHVLMYSSSGTTASHLLIHDNYMQGLYPVRPGVDGYSGGGVLMYGATTDTAATTTAFVDVYNNTVVGSSNYGMAIAVGHDINIHNNKIISSGYLADCTFATVHGAVGIYNWNYFNSPNTIFFNNIVQTNTIGLISNDGTGKAMRNDMWLPGQNNNLLDNVNWSPNDSLHPTVADEEAQAASWLHTTALAHQKIGIDGVDVYANLDKPNKDLHLACTAH
jgi:hypothetical protein